MVARITIPWSTANDIWTIVIKHDHVWVEKWDETVQTDSFNKSKSSKHYKPTAVLFFSSMFLKSFQCTVHYKVFFPFLPMPLWSPYSWWSLENESTCLLCNTGDCYPRFCLISGMGSWSLRTPVTQTMPCTSWTVKICAGSVWSWSTREDRGGTEMDMVGVMGAAAGAVSTVSFVISTNFLSFFPPPSGTRKKWRWIMCFLLIYSGLSIAPASSD